MGALPLSPNERLKKALVRDRAHDKVADAELRQRAFIVRLIGAEQSTNISTFDLLCLALDELEDIQNALTEYGGD